MSADFFLCCKTCETAIHFGKKIAKRDGALIMQGIFSEERLDWLSKDLAWTVTQSFLQVHEGHELIFASDYDFPEVQIYIRTEADELLDMQNREQH